MRIRDGDWWLVDWDPALSRSTWAIQNPDGSVTYRIDYEVGDTMEANRAAAAEARADWSGDWHRVASIPMPVFWDRLAEAVRQGDQGYIARFLNDGDNAAWRTRGGRL